MHKIVIGLIIGVVIGVLFGTSVVAPRLQSSPAPADSPGPERAIVVAREESASDTSDTGAVRMLTVASAHDLETTLPGTILSRTSDYVRNLSGNAYGFAIQAPGILSEETGMPDAVRSGVIDAVFLSAGALADDNPTLSIFAGLPFGPAPAELIAWIQTADGAKAWADGSSATGLHALPCGIDSGHFAGWFNKKIRAAEDLSGLKIQTEGITARIYERLGAEITRYPETAVTDALNDGTVDAVVASSAVASPSVASALRDDRSPTLYKNTRYLYVPGWQQSAGIYALLLRTESWEALPAAFRNILESACRDNMLFSASESAKRQFQTLKTLVADGMDIQKLPADIVAAARAIWQDMVDAEVREDDRFAKHWQALQVFRDDYEIWQDLNAQ